MLLKKKEYDENYIGLEWFVKKAEVNPFFERGWGNGYAIVPRNNSLYKLSLEEVYRVVSDDFFIDSELTWAGEMDHEGKLYQVLGFDTAHAMDSQITWPKEKVEQQAKLLAKKIKKYNKC